MKRVVLLTVIISTLIFSGCASKSSIGNDTAKQLKSSTTSGVGGNSTSDEATITTSEKVDNTQYNFQPLKPGTVKQLTPTQKSQVNNKLNSVITNIDNSLNSLDDIKDIDLDSVN